MSEHKSRRARGLGPLVAIVMALGLGAGVWYLASGPNEPSAVVEGSSETPTTVPTSSPLAGQEAGARKQAEARTLARQEPRTLVVQDPKHQRIAVRGDRGVDFIFLRVEPHPEGRRIFRVKVADGPRARPKAWASMLNAAAFVALDNFPDAPRGLRVALEVGEVAPRPGMLAPLSAALRMAASGNLYPIDALVDGLVAPDGTLLELEERARLERFAARAQLRYVHGGTLATLLLRWGLGERPRPAKTARERIPPPADLYALNWDEVREGLRRVLGSLLAKKPSRLPTPPDWRDLMARAEARLITAKVRNVDELLTLGVGAAAIRLGGRLVRFSSLRLLGYTQRLIRNETAVQGWPQIWLTALVAAHVSGLQHVRDWLIELPEGVERPRLIEMPRAWLGERRAALQTAGDAFQSILNGVVSKSARVPRPYPHDDLRNLVWGTRMEQATRSPAADWGGALVRTARIWSQLCLALTLRPTRLIDTVEPDALKVKDTAALYGLLERARSSAARAAASTQRRDGHVLLELDRLRSRAPKGHDLATSDAIRATEDLWTVVVLSREAKLAADALEKQPARPRHIPTSRTPHQSPKRPKRTRATHR